MAQKKNESNVGVIGAALAGVAAAAAGAYFIYGTKQGQKAKKKISSVALKVKGEVLEKMEKLQDINEETYKNVVANVLKKYEKVKDHTDEIKDIATELHGYWKHIQKHMTAKPKAKSKSRTVSKK